MKEMLSVMGAFFVYGMMKANDKCWNVKCLVVRKIKFLLRLFLGFKRVFF